MVTSLSVHSIVGAVGAVVVIFAARAWTFPLHRTVAENSGIVVAILATATAIATPLLAGSPRLLAGVQLIIALAVCAGIAWWRPKVGAGALTFAVPWSVMGAVSMWEVPWGLIMFVGVTAAVGVVATLRVVPRPWSVPGLWGLAPLAAATALVAATLLLSVVTPAFFDLADAPGLGTPTSAAWAGAAVMAASLAFLLLERWRHPLPVGSFRWVPAVGAGVGTLTLALVASSRTDQPLAAVGAALTLAAIIQWFISRWWHATVRPAVRHVAVVIATVGGLHGAAVFASVSWSESAGDRGSQWVALVSVAFSLATLAAATLRTPASAGVGVALVATAAASAGTWSATQSGGPVALAAAITTLAIVVIARMVPRRIALPMAWGTAPAAAVAALVATITALDGVINLALVRDLYVDGLDPWIGLGIAVAAVVAAPVAARLWNPDDAAARERTSRDIAAPALVVAVVCGLAWFVDAAGEGSADYVAAVAVGMAVAAYLVTLVSPWRAARWATDRGWIGDRHRPVACGARANRVRGPRPVASFVERGHCRRCVGRCREVAPARGARSRRRRCDVVRACRGVFRPTPGGRCGPRSWP